MFRGNKNIFENSGMETEQDVINPVNPELSDEDKEIVDDTIKKVSPTLIADHIADEDAPVQEMVYNESMGGLEAFLKGNSMLSESYVPSSKNNAARRSRTSAKERLKNIYVLKISSMNETAAFKKYKAAVRAKNRLFKEMLAESGDRAELLTEATMKKLDVGRIRTVIQRSRESVDRRLKK